VGTLSGEWIPNPHPNIKPIENTDIPGLWVFAFNDGKYIKMVGMQYGEGAVPKRVDGRAMRVRGNNGEINSNTIPQLWSNASIKDISEEKYTLTVSNNSPLQSVNQCMEQTAQSGTSIFSITNMNSNGLAQCASGKDVETPSGALLQNVDEPQCLKNPQAESVFTVETSEGNSYTLGKTYLGKKEKGNKKMIFHEYPDSMLSMGKQYMKHGDFDSPDNNLTDADITNASSEQCKQYCINRGQDCMPSIKNNGSCPDGIEAVNTGFLNKNGFLSSDQMSLDFQCETEANVSKEINSLDASYKTLTDEVIGLRKENNNILKGFQEVRNDVEDKSNDYNDIQKQIEKHKNNPTVGKLLMDSQQLQTTFSMRNTSLVLGLILLSIFLLRVLRK
jgi:predicted patatin/cPLA2 family phospholipase